MIKVCKNKNNHCVLTTRRNASRTTFIGIKNNQRSIIALPNKVFDKQYKIIEHSPISAIETWIVSTIPMTVSVRKEIQMVIAIFRNKIVAKADTFEELPEVNEKSTIVDGIESLEGANMKQLVKLYNMTLGKEDKVKSIPGVEGDINEAANAVLDALDAYEIPEKPVKEKKTKAVSGVPRDGVIKVLVEENPKRKGSKSYDRFENYKTGMTVADAIEAGVTSGDINWDIDKGYIAVDGINQRSGNDRRE